VKKLFIILLILNAKTFSFSDFTESLNFAREKRDLEPLTYSIPLEEVAELYMLEVLAHGYISHDFWDDEDERRLGSTLNLPHDRVTELLQWGYLPPPPDTIQVLRFFSSPPHRDALLSPTAKYIGVSHASHGIRYFIVVYLGYKE
jgi:uncharacterized protein YkwD